MGMRWAVHAACVWEEINMCRVLVEKPEGKRRIRTPELTGLRAGQTVVRNPGQTRYSSLLQKRPGLLWLSVRRCDGPA